MKSIRIDLPRDLDKVEIVTLADLHIGDEFCDYKLVESWVNQIKETPNMYCILNGDLMNNAIKSSVSNTYKDTLSPSQQLYYLKDLLMPIKDKILAITTGNHERRTSKDSDIHLMQTLSTFLELDDRFCDEGAVLFIRVGETNKQATGKSKKRQVCYSMYVTHGSGGARLSNPAVKLGDYIDADIYIHSHIHQPQVYFGSCFRTDTKNSKVNKYDRMFVITGATLKYGGYAQVKKYAPSSNRNPIIVLDGRKKFFWQHM